MYNIKLYRFYIMSGIKINMNLHVLNIKYEPSILYNLILKNKY